MSKIDWNAVSAVTTAILTFVLVMIERGRDRRETAARVRRISKDHFTQALGMSGLVQNTGSLLRHRFPKHTADIIEGFEEASLIEGGMAFVAVDQFIRTMNEYEPGEWPISLHEAIEMQKGRTRIGRWSREQIRRLRK